MKKVLLFALFTFFSFLVFAQERNIATISGVVLDDDDHPLANVSIQLLNKNQGTTTNADGSFTITIAAKKAVALVFSHTGFIPSQKNYFLNSGEQENTTIKLAIAPTNLKEVVVKDDKTRRESGSVAIDPSRSLVNPSPISGIESLIKVFVGSNNELTSQYSVRGGNYDENLVYVNDFEVIRPYLIRNAQQEGLSFINPAMTSGVKFYNGGFAAKYGDKMSSVLDITYKKPRKQGGSAYIGLLEQGVSVEGTSNNTRFTYILGARNRSNRNLLSSQETRGNYVPSSSDVQALFTFQATPHWQMELFGNSSATSFSLTPTNANLTASVYTSLYSKNLGLNINYGGREKDKYSTHFIGFATTYQPIKKLKLKWLLSRFENDEQERIDITGQYVFGERDLTDNSNTYGEIVNPLGSGTYQTFARNKLNITVWNAAHKGNLDIGSQAIQWGITGSQQLVNDHLNEWVYNDSAGYSLPYSNNDLQLNNVKKGKTNLNIGRLEGYFQDNIQLKTDNAAVLQLGVRYNYNSLNNEWLVSPRMGFSFKPKHWKKDVVFKASAGLYHQPPFYREMVKANGSLNSALLAQKSWQVTTGMDVNTVLFDRPARITTELYYKNMWDVVPYDVNNVRLQYFATNNAKAYAVGVETRLYAELVKDAESWLSFGIMKTMEKIDNYNYYQYKNAAGEIINANSKDKVVADSSLNTVGWMRRPTDRLITMGLFFQDYLSTNKNSKVYINTIYGSNMPYSIPGSVRYRNALIIDPYIRVDIGFSVFLLTPEKNNRRSHSPFRNFDNIAASLEVFNLIDRANTISYQLIKDYSNNTYAIPNSLTPRLLNLKLVASW